MTLTKAAATKIAATRVVAKDDEQKENRSRLSVHPFTHLSSHKRTGECELLPFRLLSLVVAIKKSYLKRQIKKCRFW